MTHSLQQVGALVALTVVATLGGCDGRHGSGHWDEDHREVDAFSRVDVTGAVTVFVQVDPDAEPSVVVSGDDNLVDTISTRVAEGTLTISSEDWVDATLPLEVWVTTRNLRGVSGSGAIELTAWGIASKRLNVDTAGAALVRLAGKVNDLRIDTAGAADVRTRALHAHDVRVDTAGASDVSVCVWRALDIEASGASDVRYYGEPTSVNTDISGAGDVTHKSKVCADFTPPVRKTFGDPCTCKDQDGNNDFVGAGHDHDGAGSPASGGGSGGDSGGSGGSGSAGSGSAGSGDSGSAGSGGSGSAGSGDSASAGSGGSGSAGSGGSGSAGSGGSDSAGSGGNTYQPGGAASDHDDDDDCDD